MAQWVKVLVMEAWRSEFRWPEPYKKPHEAVCVMCLGSPEAWKAEKGNL